MTKEAAGLDFKEEEILQMILPALERVVRQVERTLQHYSLNFKNEGVAKIYIAGQISTHKRIVDYISEQLDLPTDAIDPFISSSPSAGEGLRPESASEREALVPAVGMALSNNLFTPNFIFTYKDKEKHTIIRRINYALIGAFLFFMALFIGFYSWQGRLGDQQEAQLAELQQQLDQYSPIVDQKIILQAVAQIKRQRKNVEEFGRKYMAMALLNEICSQTPANIRLLSITAELGKLREIDLADKGNAQDKKILILEGIILGDRLTFESALAGYLVKLKNSPIINQPSIKSKSVESFENKEVLRFTAQLEII